MVQADDSFSPDYHTARARFREAAKRAKWKLESHAINGRGPGGEELSVDVAVSALGPAAKTLLISSGQHGVEGTFGSALQLALLDRWADRADLPMRCVLIHALNPFGFAWRRRGDEQNVDLNRNFLLPGEAYAGSSSMNPALESFLNPKRKLRKGEPFLLKALAALWQHGKVEIQRAVAAGQYENPQGLFYGGAGPAWQQAFLAEQIPRWTAESGDVVHLDLHTGLGGWGKCNVLVDYPLAPPLENRLRSWFGFALFRAYETQSISYRAKGSLGAWAVSQCPDIDYSFAFLEWGTYPAIKIVQGLRRENQAHHYCQKPEREYHLAKSRLAELFCPASLRWRRRVVEQGLQLIEQAERGLGQS